MTPSKFFSHLGIVALVSASLAGCSKGPETTAGPSNAPATSTTLPKGQFTESLPSAVATLPLIASGKCNMESINGVGWGAAPYVVKKGDNVSIVGWGLDDEGKRVPTSIFLRFQNGPREFYAPVETRTQRADLVEFTKENHYKDAGYKADASLANLPPGEYQAMIIMTFPDKAILCAAGRTVNVE